MVLCAFMQDRVVNYLDGLTDDELKKESKNEAKNDALSSIIKVSLKHCLRKFIINIIIIS